MFLYLAIFLLSCFIMANVLPEALLETMRQNASEHFPQGDGPMQNVFGDEPDNGSDSDNNGEAEDDSENKSDWGPHIEDPNFFKPTPVDILVVRAMLMRSKHLPPGIIDTVLDHAEFWAHSSNEIDFLQEHQDPLLIEGSSPSENKFLLRSYPVGLTGPGQKKELSEELAWDMTEAKPLPLGEEHNPDFFHGLVRYPTPTLARPVRKVVFTIRSHDQGWGGEREHRGTYKGSWTWFEAGLERFDAKQTCDPQCTYDARCNSSASKAPPTPVCSLRPLYPNIEPSSSDNEKYQYHHPLNGNEKYEIQRNKTATAKFLDYVVVWSYLDDIKPESPEAKELDERGRGSGTADGTYVRNLKLGDVVTIWAKARFPGWVNDIQRVKVDIYWAV